MSETHDDGDESPFEKCDDCGTVTVNSAAHSCPDSHRRGSRAEGRRELAENDTRPDGDLVLYLPGRTDSAYHEAEFEFDLDAMLTVPVPACDTEVHTSREWRPVTRAHAKRTGRYPCALCSTDPHE